MGISQVLEKMSSYNGIQVNQDDLWKKEMSEQLQQEMRAKIRKEDEMMLDLYKEDLPPTLAGILELERQEDMELGIERGIEKGREEGIEKGIRQVIIGLIENGFPDEMIARVANQSIEQVQVIWSKMERK